MFETIPLINKRREAFKNPRIFLTNRGAVMDKVAPYFFTTSLKKAGVAVLFQDVVGNGLKYANEAKSQGIPIVVVQHGKGASCDYLPPLNYKLLTDKLCVWGKRDRDALIDGGIPAEKIVLSGCPLFDGESSKRDEHKGINVLFAPGHIRESAKNIAVMETLMQIKGINVYAKLLSTHNRKQYGRNVIVSNSFDSDHMKKCFNAVRNADVLITNTSGTIETIALFFDIPIIFIDNLDIGVAHHEVHTRSVANFRGAHYIKRESELPEAVEKAVKDPSLLKNERRQELIETAGAGLPYSPVEKIVGTIKSMAK